jgi:acetylornithine deacetylase/succinyl-diaminopimelate desuccinylase-like protein
MNARLAATCHRLWDEQILPALHDYIAIPAKSPMFDKDWAAAGHIERVVRDAAAWVERQKSAQGAGKLHGLKLEVVRMPERTPVILFELPATKADCSDTVLLYGHLDKQPEFTGWRNDLGPWTPKVIDGKLYGRGGADDGYAVYAADRHRGPARAQGMPHRAASA